MNQQPIFVRNVITSFRFVRRDIDMLTQQLESVKSELHASNASHNEIMRTLASFERLRDDLQATNAANRSLRREMNSAARSSKTAKNKANLLARQLRGTVRVNQVDHRQMVRTIQALTRKLEQLNKRVLVLRKKKAARKRKR